MQTGKTCTKMFHRGLQILKPALDRPVVMPQVMPLEISSHIEILPLITGTLTDA